jgi:hypothetical protein
MIICPSAMAIIGTQDSSVSTCEWMADTDAMVMIYLR